MPARLLLAAALVTAGCTTPRPPPPPAAEPAPEPYLAPLDFVAPPCADGGPSVQILEHNDFICGKGDLCVYTDQRIRNPTDHSLWLFFDAMDFSAYVDEVYLERTRYDARFVVWAFYGQGYDLSLRLAQGTDIVVRNIHYKQYDHHRRPIRSAFVDRVTIDSDRSPWPRTPGFLPTQGEFDAEGLNGFIGRYEPEDEVRLGGHRRAAIHTLCIQTTQLTDVDASPAKAQAPTPR